MRLAKALKVGAVAKAAGVGVQTLHYYERLGLLPKPNRSAANYRLYGPEAIRRVRFIKKAQALGLTLEETKQSSAKDIWRKSMCASRNCAPIAVRLRKRSARGPRRTFPSGTARANFAI